MPDQDQHEHDERDEQMDQDGEANLVLELTIEPSEQSLEQLFGVDEEQLAEVAAATIARLEIDELVKISVLVTDDENLRMLNREYRDQDKATDVLSFPAQDAPIVAAPADQLWQTAEDDFGDDDQSGGADGATPQAQQAASALDADEFGEELDESDELFEDFDEDLDELDEDALDLGDIAISYDAVKRQAAQAGHAAAWEFCYLLCHGILHLAGYDDESESGYNAMVKLQDEILTEVNIQK
jgi:probable rRNA maturation factor